MKPSNICRVISKYDLLYIVEVVIDLPPVPWAFYFERMHNPPTTNAVSTFVGKINGDRQEDDRRDRELSATYRYFTSGMFTTSVA